MHSEEGDYTLFVRLADKDFANFDAGVFDFRFTGSLAIGEVDTHRISGLTAAMPIVAWIDTVKPGRQPPDPILAIVWPPANPLHS